MFALCSVCSYVTGRIEVKVLHLEGFSELCLLEENKNKNKNNWKRKHILRYSINAHDSFETGKKNRELCKYWQIFLSHYTFLNQLVEI